MGCGAAEEEGGQSREEVQVEPESPAPNPADGEREEVPTSPVSPRSEEYAPQRWFARFYEQAHNKGLPFPDFDTFRAADGEKDDFVTRADLLKHAEEYGHEGKPVLSEFEVDKILEIYDGAGGEAKKEAAGPADGKLNEDEFAMIVGAAIFILICEVTKQISFKLWDTDKTGLITHAQIQHFIESNEHLAKICPLEQTQLVIDAYDKNADGKLNEAEWCVLKKYGSMGQRDLFKWSNSKNDYVDEENKTAKEDMGIA